MGLIDINDIFPNGLDFYDAFELLWPGGLYLLGMAVYAIFIFKFYRFVAARDMFEMDLSKYEESRFRWVRGFLHLVMYVAKYIILFPMFAFFWFAVLTLILTFLSKDRAFSEVLLIALVTVSAIRVTAYYREELSRDLAKILPFAVLGIFLIDASFFEAADSLKVLAQIENHQESILYYMMFLIGLEFVLRLLMGITALFLAILDRLYKEPTDQEEVEASEPEPELASETEMAVGAVEEPVQEDENPQGPMPAPAPALPTIHSSRA